jgi:hypothetical protein
MTGPTSARLAEAGFFFFEAVIVVVLLMDFSGCGGRRTQVKQKTHDLASRGCLLNHSINKRQRRRVLPRRPAGPLAIRFSTFLES